MTAEYNSERYAIINRWDPTHLEKIDRLLPLEAGDRVLEIGCGQGHLTKRLAARGIDITGIDANPNAAHVSESERVFYMRAEALEFDDGVFDSAIGVHSIEHIPDLQGAFAEMARVLKPGGKALFIYPAEPIKGLYAIPTAIILHKNPLMAREIHCQKLTPNKVLLMLGPYGFEERHREFNLLKTPQFVSVLEKVKGGPKTEGPVGQEGS
ncbi:MAG: class I SAM-dependent methyltransferase [Acidimicrobiia bacterium]